MEHTVYGVIWEYNQPNKNILFMVIFIALAIYQH
jgi:hypothetical protein